MTQLALCHVPPEPDILAALKRLWQAASPEAREAFNRWRRRAFLARARERQRRRAEAKA